MSLLSFEISDFLDKIGSGEKSKSLTSNCRLNRSIQPNRGKVSDQSMQIPLDGDWDLPPPTPTPTPTPTTAIASPLGLQTRELPSPQSVVTKAIKFSIPGDHSCLFNAVSYCCTGLTDQASELREHCIDAITNQPDEYTAAMLGQPPDLYCEWIASPQHWGGYIEIVILSRFFEVEIAVVHIRDCTIVPVNGCGATKRIYILFDGLHYDSILFQRSGGGDSAVVSSDDDRATDFAVQIARKRQLKKAYCVDRTKMVQCDQCAKLLRGEQEAEAHRRKTGHCGFTPLGKF
jgi:hypothetical protein